MGYPELLFIVESLQGRPANAVERTIATEIVRVVDQAEPVFGSKLDDEIVMLETAWQETRLRDIDGDRGRSHGYWQLQRVARGLPVEQQAAVAYARLRESERRCGVGVFSLAAYVSASCTNRAGRRVSAFRIAEARRWREQVEVSGVAEAQR